MIFSECTFRVPKHEHHFFRFKPTTYFMQTNFLLQLFRHCFQCFQIHRIGFIFFFTNSYAFGFHNDNSAFLNAFVFVLNLKIVSPLLKLKITFAFRPHFLHLFHKFYDEIFINGSDHIYASVKTIPFLFYISIQLPRFIGTIKQYEIRDQFHCFDVTICANAFSFSCDNAADVENDMKIPKNIPN